MRWIFYCIFSTKAKVCGWGYMLTCKLVEATSLGSQCVWMCGISLLSQIDCTIPDVERDCGPKIAATPFFIKPQTAQEIYVNDKWVQLISI